MSPSLRIGLGVALLTIAAGLLWGLLRVGALQEREVSAVSKPIALGEVTAGDAPYLLTKAELAEGDHVVFEVCVGDELAPERWAGRMAFDVWYQPAGEKVLVTLLDEAFFAVVRRGGGRACAKIGEAPQLGMAGEYAVGLSLPEAGLADELGGIGVQAKILARPALTDADRSAVWITLLGALLLSVVLIAAGPRAQDPAPDDTSGSRSVIRVAIGTVVFIALMLGLGAIPLPGATAGYIRGVLLAAVQVGLAIGLVVASKGKRLDALALGRPTGGAWMLLGAVVAGGAVWIAGSWIAGLIPSTGRAPIETFVSFPSGRVAYGALSVVIPLAEELFFRGFVYGTLDRRFGANTATVVTIVLFAAFHLPQQWGAWGAATSVLFTGIVLTLLRRHTRSTSVPAAAHVVHNAVNTVLGLG